jgi:protein TonB
MVGKIQNDNTLKLLLTFSIIIHAFIFIVKFNPISISKSNSQEKAQKLLLNLIKNNKARQIVETVESENKLNSEPKFLSKKDNNFLRETKARRVERFNIAGRGVVNGKNKAKTKSSAKKKELTLASLRDKYMESIQDFKKEEVQENRSPAFGMKNGVEKSKGLHSSNDYIEDLPLGDFTQVNTQEYKYFGFYNRIKYKLEKYWGRNIESQAKKLLKSGRSIASDQNHLTSLVIQINGRGEILNVQVKSTSGLKELDSAAVKSFNQAGPFPNPPKGMVKNGVATIEWGFVVNT